MAYSNYAEWKRARERNNRSGVTTSSSPSQQTSNKPASRNAGAHANYASWKAERERKAIQNRITNADTYTDAQEWQTGVGNLLREYQNFSSRWSEDPQTYDDYRRRMEAYSNQYDTLIGGLHQDTESADSVSRTQLALRRAMEGVRGLRDFYAQFGSQQEYDAALQYSNDLANLDLDAAQAEIDAWQQERDNISTMSPEEITAYIEENKSWLPGYEEGVFYDFNHNILADYDSRITARQAYLNQIRNARQLSEMEQVIGENDFAANSAFTGNRSLGVGSEADRTYLYINDPEYREDYSIGRNMSGGMSAFDPAEIESISMMTDDERSIFNYYYNTQGEDAAMEYLDKLTSTIRQRRAAERFNELEGRTGAELAFGVAAGLDQFGSGIRSLLNTEDDYIAPSWRQYASGMVREDLQDARISRNSNAANSAGQVAYDTIVSGSNMLPSILASAAVGVLNPVAGQVTGAVLMGASASGNAYQEMLNLGYSKAQARGYSALVGASEAGLSYLLSGISKLGGAIPGGITETVLKNVDNAFARVAIQLGTNAVSEFTEEYLQEVLTPWFQNLALNAQNDVKLFTPEALYSGLLGALTAGVMEGVGTVSSAVQTRNTGRDFLGSTATLDDLKLLAELMPDNAEVQDLAARVNENTNAYTVGRFYEAVESGMPAQFKADLEATRTQVVDSLLTAGVTQKDADIIAGAVTGQMLGRKLTASQNRLLAKLSDTIPGLNRIISESMKSNEMKRAAIRGELNTAVRGMANIKRSTETATEAATTAEQQTSPATQTEAENAYQVDRRGTYSTVESLADEYDVRPSAIARIAQESTTQFDEKAFAESMRSVLAFTQETTLSREEAITALQKNVTTLNAQQIAEAVILGWDIRNAVSAEKQRAYDMGFAGQDIGDVLDSKMLSHLTEAQRRESFNEGAKVAKEAVTSGEKALPKTASVAYRKGSVRFDGDAKAISSKFKMTQRSAYIILERIAQLTGMDIVLFASKTDAQGNFIGEQGKFNSANPNEIRIDVNAGLNNVDDMRSLANYVMLRTFTHEFVHSIEVNAPAQYRALKEAVFAEIRRNGKENVENLIMIEQEKGGKKEDGSYKLSYDDASHEVLAQSLVDVLPQSTFIETLATQHRNIFEKLYAALKRFMRTIRHRFEQMTSAIPSEAAALKRDVDGAMQYAQHIVDLFDKAALAAVETVQSRNMDSADAMNNTEAFEDSSVAIRNQIRPPYNENTKAFAEFADGLNAEAKETFDLFYNFYNLSRITNTTNAAGKPVKAINISAPFLRVDEWNAKISSDAKWGAAAARLAESLPISVRENMHMNEDGSLTETPLEKEFKMQRSLAQRLVDSLPLEKIDAVYDIEGRKVELPAGKARQSVGGEAYRRAVIGEVRKLFHDGRLKQVSIGTLSKDRWGSLGFLAANGKTGASGDFTTICPQMMFNRGCFYCYRRAALESGVNNKLVAERVWYAGEILRIKQKDIDALNENGGLRIQSFGDWMPHFSAMLADVLHDAELRGLQVKIITKEPSMIQYLAALRGQGLGNNLYFNLSADYAIEKAPAAANTAGSASLDHINPDRPFMRDEDKQMWWKRAMTVEEAGSFRSKYPWVNTRIVATDAEEFIRGLKDPTVDVVTGYHGNIRNYERIDSETGARKVEVEALGDAGMPRFVYENGEWVTEYEGKTSTHKQLAERIREENLFLEYYAKVCCQTGRCATCKGKCGQMARSLAMKNATNRDSKSRAYWQEHMSSAVEDISEASPEVDSLVAEFRQRMQNLSRNNENPTGKVRYQARPSATDPKPAPSVNPERSQRRENLTDRAVLEQALADPKKIGNLTEGESYALQLWGERMNDVKALRAQRKEQVRIYNENSNENGNRDEAVKAKNRIKLYDERIEKAERKLREVENGAAMKTVLPRARTVAVEEYESAQRERLKQYRLIHSGENAVRPDDTPYTTDGENRVSYTARTVKGAGVTPDDFAELIDNEILYDGFTHIPLSNKEATNEATKIIQKKGWESALAEWKSAVRSGKTSAVMVAEGALFLNNAARAGNKDLWLDILNDYTNLSTNSAQAVQAFRILKKLSPSDKLYMVQRSVEQMVQDMHLQQDIEVDKKLSEEYLNAETETARDKALEKITQNIADQIPSTLMDKWTALRYLNMLGNFRTQVRNVVGNVGMRMVSELKNSIMVGMERIAEAATNGKYKRTRSLFVSKDLMKSAKADYDLVKDLLLSGGKYSADEAASSRFASMTNEKRRIFKFKILEAYRKLTNTAMEGADALFAKSAYTRALAGYLKARGVIDADFGKVSDTLMDEARAFAIRDAQEVTFRDTNALSGWISKIGRRKDTPKFARLISEGTIPFRKTPTNVLVRAEEYTVGAINPLVKWVGDLASGQKDSSVTASQVLEAISKQLTGTGLFLLGMALRASGRLTGSGEGDDEDSFERMNGWQNYAIVFPESGVNMTIDFLSPAAIPILMGAQLYDLNTENGIQLKDISNVLLSITDPLVQMSMLQGINDTLDNIKFAESGLLQIALNSALNYLTQGLTNSLLGQLERSFEKQRMTTYIYEDGQLSSSAQRNIGKMSAKTPFIDYNQIPYINAWGEREESPGLFANLMYNLFSPSYFNRGSNDAVSAEILRLNSAQSSINVFPQTPDRTISYEGKSGEHYDDVALTAEEYVALATAQGQLQRNIVEDLISSPLYQDLTDSEKALAIRNAYEYARESARIEIFEDYPGYSAKWMEDIDENVAGGILNHVRESSYDDIGSDFLAGRITRDEAIALYVESGRKTEQEAESAILRYQYELDTENDYDDLEEMFVDGTISSSNAERYLMEYGGMYRLDAETTIRQWECEKETGIRYSDIRDLYVSGDITARRAQSLRVEYGGASLDDAEKTVLKWQCEIDTGVRYEDIGSAYLSGEISRRNAISWQMKYGEKDEDEAELYLTAYEWRDDNPQYGDLSNDAIGRYIEYCEPMNIDASIFYEARHFCSDIQSDGTSGNVKAQYVEYIESLDLPFEQRRALWFALKNKSWKETGTPYA